MWPTATAITWLWGSLAPSLFPPMGGNRKAERWTRVVDRQRIQTDRLVDVTYRAGRFMAVGGDRAILVSPPPS
jgi:hypothetical protein